MNPDINVEEQMLGEFALLVPSGDEPPDISEGYIELERVQRLAGRWVIQEYRFAVALWYELLTHYRRALEGQTPALDNAGGARREILTLGLGSSKIALDATLAGYYSVAMACIRHIAECWFNSRYLECHPDKWPAFYRRTPGTPKVKVPDTDGLIKDVIACNHPSRRVAPQKGCKKYGTRDQRVFMCLVKEWCKRPATMRTCITLARRFRSRWHLQLSQTACSPPSG